MVIQQKGTLELALWLSLQCYEAAKWRGRWRFASLLPLPLMAGLGSVVIVGALESTNLWPLVVHTGAPLALSYCVLLLPLRSLCSQARTSGSRLLYLLAALLPAVQVVLLLLE